MTLAPLENLSPPVAGGPVLPNINRAAVLTPPARPQATTLLGMLLRFQARARLSGPTQGGVAAAGQMAWFVLDGGLLIPFWINPMTYRETSAVVHADLPNKNLFRRTYFTAVPQVLSIEGTTGTAGWDARKGGMVDLGRIKPFVATRNLPLHFFYPYMFPKGRFCFVNRFVQRVDTDSPLMYFYQIDLAVYPEGAGLPCCTIRESLPPGLRLPPIGDDGLPGADTGRPQRVPNPATDGAPQVNARPSPWLYPTTSA